MRTGGAEALAFDVACLSGPEAALPHGAPGDRPIRAGTVLLFDFGAQVAGYRSDMTRTLFVGEPTPARPRRLRARRAGPGGRDRRPLEAAVDGGRTADRCRSGRAIDAVARGVIEAAGHGAAFRPRDRARDRPRDARGAVARSARARTTPLPSARPSSRSSPGVYLEGETGVRIEDLVVLDAAAGRLERLTRFPREVLVVGG